MNPTCVLSKIGKVVPALFLLPLVLSPLQASADGILVNGSTYNLSDANNYAILFTGGSGHLSVSNDTVDGNIGIGGTGGMAFSGPGTVNGAVNFAGANIGQYSSTNGSNVGPSSVNYGVTQVQTDLNALAGYSTLAGGAAGTSISFNNGKINGVTTTTLNASTGTLESVNGQMVEVFNVTSYSETDSNTVNILGNGYNVIFNFAYSSNTNLGGQIGLTALVPDDVLWNFTSSGQNVGLTNNGGIFQGIVLAPNDVYNFDNTNLIGRVFGGDSHNLQFVSGANLLVVTPEPSSLILLGTGLLGMGVMLKRRFA